MTQATGSRGVGPSQLVAIGFDTLTEFRGEILDEIERLTSEAAARILDVLVVVKETNGDLIAVDLQDLGVGDLSEADEALGTMLGELMGFTVEGGDRFPPTEDVLAASGIGVTVDDIQSIGDSLSPGTAAGLMLIEHRWAIGLRNAIRDAGGRVLAQGFLSMDGLLLVGQELARVSEAIEAIEIANALEAEAIIRALEAKATIEIAAEIKAAIAAQTIRRLVEAGIITPAAIDEATAAIFGEELVATTAADMQGGSR